MPGQLFAHEWFVLLNASCFRRWRHQWPAGNSAVTAKKILVYYFIMNQSAHESQFKNFATDPNQAFLPYRAWRGSTLCHWIAFV